MKTNQIISIIVLLIVFSAGSFFVGTKYQQKKITSQFGQRFSNNAGPGQGTGRGNTNGATGKQGPNGSGFNQTIGEITSIDDSSITVKTTDGGSKIILISDSTTVNQLTSMSKADLKVGTKIAAMGNSNTDGSITGKKIDINPVDMTPPATTTPAAKN